MTRQISLPLFIIVTVLFSTAFFPWSSTSSQMNQFPYRIATCAGRSRDAGHGVCMVYGLAGQKDEANKILNELVELNKRRYVTPAAFPTLYIGLDNKDQRSSGSRKRFTNDRTMSLIQKSFRSLIQCVPIRDSPI